MTCTYCMVPHDQSDWEAVSDAEQIEAIREQALAAGLTDLQTSAVILSFIQWFHAPCVGRFHGLAVSREIERLIAQQKAPRP